MTADAVRVRPADARSGAIFERFTDAGQRWFRKRLRPENDWIMRITGDRDFRTAKIWRAGIMHRAAAVVEHAVVDVDVVDGELTILMRDVGDRLVPEGDGVLDTVAHRGLLDGIAALGAEFRGWRDDLGLVPMRDRVRFFAPDNIAAELARPDTDPVLRMADAGWARLDERAPALAALARAVHARPEALVAALEDTPATFVHGDPKLGNLGWTPDGGTVLLDWAYPGAGPLTWDLGWYLALNAARLPESKEDAAAAFRAALDRRGVATAGWFDRQLALTQLGVAAVFGWEKALGDAGELAWWDAAAAAGAEVLDGEVPGWR